MTGTVLWPVFHNIPATVKAANLARWFPPWTVSREQWTIIMRSSVSGVAVDTLLFSRIGVPLFHQYRVFSRPGTHEAFIGTYMTRIRTFLEESDAASLRARHRRCARRLLHGCVRRLRERPLVVNRTAPLSPVHLVGRALESGNLHWLLQLQPHR